MGAFPWIVSDELWERIEPLLPRKERRFRYPGRKPLPDRQVLCGMRAAHGHPVGVPAQGTGFGSGMTCWRRLRDWNEAGVWQRLHEVLLAELNAAGRLDWSRCVVDSSHTQGARRGSHTGPSPGARGRTGSKHHLITDGRGTPLAVILAGGNRNDVTQLLPLLDAVPPIQGRVGRPRRRAVTPYADPGYDHDCSASRSGPAASYLPSHGAEPGAAPDWASAGGWSSGPSSGCAASADCACAGNDERTYTKRFSHLPAV